MRILIAGFGSIGRRHFRNLLSLGERDIIFYRSGRSTLPDDELTDFVVEMELDAAFGHRPDAVIISNPTSLHLDVAIPAAEMGCHIFLEKPISHNLDRIVELKSALARGGGQVLVGFQFRFHPGLKKILECLSRNEIGRPLSFRAHWGEYLPDWHPWEDYRKSYSARKDLGGGVVLTLCHPLDYLRWMLGEIDALWAFTSQSGDLNLSVEDTSEIGLRFANGAVGSVHLNYNQQPPVHHLEIVGSKGTIRWDNDNDVVSLFNGVNWATYSPPKGFERNDLFLAQTQHFLEIIRGENQPICTLDDGIKALELALAVHHSAKNNQLFQL